MLEHSAFTIEGLSQLKAIAPILFNIFYLEATALEDATVTQMRSSTPTGRDDYVLIIEFTDARPPKDKKSKTMPIRKMLLSAKSDNNEGNAIEPVDEQKLFGRSNLFTQSKIPISAQPSKQETITSLIDKRNGAFRTLLLQYYEKAMEKVFLSVLDLLHTVSNTHCR